MTGDDSHNQGDSSGSSERLLRTLAYEAVGKGDMDTLLSLTKCKLETWPRERIKDSDGWYILAILSQVGSDSRRFGLAATEISRKVALTARLSYFNTTCMADVVCRTVALAAFEDLVQEHVVRCLEVEGHWGHYAAARLGLAAFRQKNIEILDLCLRRIRLHDESSSRTVDTGLEITQLECFMDILRGRQPRLDRLVDLLKQTDPSLRVRYYYTLSLLLDPEDLDELVFSGMLGTRHAMLVD
ncbi:MAG: hypothetical protein R3F46_07865 [bacterium]